jgi:thiamine-monophosphate kinase
MTTDSLIEGAHFLPGAAARSLGHRAMAVNLSDIAAMGAEPCWALLSLTMPAVDAGWLEAFSAGFGAPLREHRVALVGGNLARGPLNIGVQLCGQLPSGGGLLRTGARNGDLLCVSGTLGDAAAGRDAASGALVADAATRTALQACFEFPTARVALGRQLRELATACIDISDGLWRDLQRLTEASGCGATVVAEQLPLSPALRASAGEGALQYALHGGEDYELLFTVPPDRLAAVQAAARSVATACTVIGRCETPPGLWLQLRDVRQSLKAAGFDHFTLHR